MLLKRGEKRVWGEHGEERRWRKGDFKELGSSCAAPHAACQWSRSLASACSSRSLSPVLEGWCSSASSLPAPYLAPNPCVSLRRVGFAPAKLQGGIHRTWPFLPAGTASVQGKGESSFPAGKSNPPPDTDVPSVGTGSSSRRLQQGKLRLDGKGKNNSEPG